ncbi:hypothetical protein D3C77_616000 [compost metagenome]
MLCDRSSSCSSSHGSVGRSSVRVSSRVLSESGPSDTSTEDTRSFRPSMRLTSATGFSSSVAISSGEGSWSSFWVSSRAARR